MNEFDSESDDEPIHAKRRRVEHFVDHCNDDGGNASDEEEATKTVSDQEFIDDITSIPPPSPYAQLELIPNVQPTLEQLGRRRINRVIANIESRVETPEQTEAPAAKPFLWIPATFTPRLEEIYTHATQEIGDEDMFWRRMDNRYRLQDSEEFDGFGLPPECHNMDVSAAITWLSTSFPYPLLRYIGSEVWLLGEYYPESWTASGGAPHFSWGQPVTGSPKLKAFCYEWADMKTFTSDARNTADICSKVMAISACVRLGVVTRNRVLLLGLAYHAVVVPNVDEAACRCLRVDKVADCLSLLLAATVQIGDYDEKLVDERPQKMWWRYFMLRSGIYTVDGVFKYFTTTQPEQDVKNMWTILFNSNQNVTKFVEDCALTVTRMVHACGRLQPIDVLTHRWYTKVVPDKVWEAVRPYSTLSVCPGINWAMVLQQAAWIASWLTHAMQITPLQVFLSLGHVLEGSSNRHRLMVIWGTQTETGKSLFVSLVMKSLRARRFTALRPDELDRLIAYAADGDLWCMDDANTETLIELMKHRSMMENTSVQSRKLFCGYTETVMPGGLVATNVDMSLLPAEDAETDKFYYIKKRGYWFNMFNKLRSQPLYNVYLELAFAGMLREIYSFCPDALDAWKADRVYANMPIWSSVMNAHTTRAYEHVRGQRRTSYMPYVPDTSPLVNGIVVKRPILGNPADFCDACRTGDVHDMLMQQKFGVARLCQLRADLRSVEAAKTLGLEDYVRQYAAPVAVRTPVACDGYGPDALNMILRQHDNIDDAATVCEWQTLLDRTRAQLRGTEDVWMQHDILVRTWPKLLGLENRESIFGGLVIDTDLGKTDLDLIMQTMNE